MQILSEQGESGLRLAEVAAAINIKEPTIFHYFKNRQELIEAAQIEFYRSTYLSILEPMNAALKFSDSREQWRSAVNKVLEDSFAPGREAVRSVRSGVFGTAQTNPVVREQVVATHREVIAFMTDLFSQARNRGWVRVDCDLEALVGVLLGIVAGRGFIEIDPDFAHFRGWDRLVMDLVPRLMEPDN